MIICMSEYKNRRECSVDGCDLPYFGKGYCGRHYQRVLKHGHLNQTRPGDWGTRKRHPLYQTWANHKRGPNGIAPEWHDFYRFLADLGDRPSDRHMLVTAVPGTPAGPGNFQWVLKGRGIPRPPRKGERCSVDGCNNKPHALDLCHKHHARWTRHGTLADPAPKPVDDEKRRATRVRANLAKYGLTPAQYDQMYAAQGGACALCHNPQRGQKPLCVDHHHGTGIVRGLLCSPCNTGIGMLGDSSERLNAASAYVARFERSDAA